jgi:hypothetical protein
MIGIYPAQGPLAGRFNVRSCFYPSYQGDPAYVSLSVLENRPNLRQNSIEIKLRSGIFILVSVSAIESIATTFKQLA